MSHEEQETFCVAHAEKLDHMAAAMVELGNDVSWLVKIGKWVLYAIIGIITTIGPVMAAATWKIYSEHTDMQARLSAGEKTDSDVKAWRDHLGERATKDHRECHTERGGI